MVFPYKCDSPTKNSLIRDRKITKNKNVINYVKAKFLQIDTFVMRHPVYYFIF